MPSGALSQAEEDERGALRLPRPPPIPLVEAMGLAQRLIAPSHRLAELWVL